MADVNIEACFLACCILSTAVLEDYHGHYEPKDFVDPRHQGIWRSLISLLTTGRRDIDGAQVKSELLKLGQYDAAGGDEYLRSMLDAVPSAASAKYYADILNDRIMRRSLFNAANSAMYSIDRGDTIAEVLDRFEAQLMQIRSSKRFAGDAQANEGQTCDLVAQAFQSVFDAANGKPQPVMGTGFIDLDNKLDGGLRPGDMCIVAARPSMGKSAFALNIATHVAIAAPVVFVSLEMDQGSLSLRMLSAESGIPASSLRKGLVRSDEFPRLSAAVEALRPRDMWVVSVPSMSPLEVRAQVRRIARKKPLGLIVVDYLQLMQVEHLKTENRNQEVGILSRMMKGLALELQCPMILLSQLNRSAEGRSDHRPHLSDLRESGNLEQDADVVILLHREDYYHLTDPSWSATNQAEVFVAKHRNGATGLVECSFDPLTMTFHTKEPGR